MTSMVKFNRFNNVVYNYILMGILIMASESWIVLNITWYFSIWNVRAYSVVVKLVVAFDNIAVRSY